MSDNVAADAVEEITPSEQVEPQEPVVEPKPEEQVDLETPPSQAQPEPEKKHEPSPDHPRWQGIYWENKELKRKLDKLESKFDEYKTQNTERERGSITSQLSEIDAEMEALARSGDIDFPIKYHELNRKRDALKDRLREEAQGVPQNQPQVDPREQRAIEFRDEFLRYPDNIHLTLPESQGGSLEVAQRITSEMSQDPVWKAMLYDNTPMYWKELSDRVTAAKKKPAPDNPVEAPTQKRGTTGKRLTIGDIAQKENATIKELEHLAHKMYPNNPDPVAHYVEVYAKYGG